MKKALLISLIILGVCLYYLIGYHIIREQFDVFFVCISLLFTSYYFLYRNHQIYDFNYLIIISILYRVLFIFSVPSLSDDFYRFLWDGYIINSGISPFQFIPHEVKANFPNKEYLLNNMNSPFYYSVYPPAIQLIFQVSTYFSL